MTRSEQLISRGLRNAVTLRHPDTKPRRLAASLLPAPRVEKRHTSLSTSCLNLLSVLLSLSLSLLIPLFPLFVLFLVPSDQVIFSIKSVHSAHPRTCHSIEYIYRSVIKLSYIGDSTKTISCLCLCLNQANFKSK